MSNSDSHVNVQAAHLFLVCKCDEVVGCCKECVPSFGLFLF